MAKFDIGHEPACPFDETKVQLRVELTEYPSSDGVPHLTPLCISKSEFDCNVDLLIRQLEDLKAKASQFF